MMYYLASANHMPWEKSSLMILGKRHMNVTGNQHGIDHGWFYWPFNFDPRWLLSCDGFEAKCPSTENATPSSAT